MTFREEFELLLRACYPLIYIPTPEEERLENAIAQCAQKMKNRTVYTWDFVDGYQDNPNNEGVGRRNPLQALEFVEQLPNNIGGIFILRDFQRFLEDVSISRKLRNLARSLKSQPKNLIIIAPQVEIPPELTEVFTVVDFPLPTA
ncbi:MAG: AAA family ATPase, partial [Crocosphaera sp.]